MTHVEELTLEIMVVKTAEKTDNQFTIEVLNEIMNVAWRKLPWKECDLLMNAVCNLNPMLSRDGELFLLNRIVN